LKLRLKEDPREWRKTVLLTALGLALLSSLLRWRHVLSQRTWLVVMAALALLALLSVLQPRWFRGFYRISVRVGFWLSQIVARIVLAILFFLVLAPLGVFFRLFGKDTLRLKPSRHATTYWVKAKENSPLDRLF
jgi:hypothetical protein